MLNEHSAVRAPAECAAAQGSSAGRSAAASQFAIWTSGAMRFGDYDPRHGASGFEFETSGLSIGADYRFGTAFALGAGFGTGRDVSDIGKHHHRRDADAWGPAVYDHSPPRKPCYLDGHFCYNRLSLPLHTTS